MSAATMSAEQFFRLLYGDDAPGFLTLFTVPGEATHWAPASDLGAAAVEVGKLTKTLNVYYGLGLRKEKLSQGRGSADDVGVLPGFCIEVDYGEDGHKKQQLPPTADDALTLIRDFPLAPTLVVHSGHGFHVYWLFPEPWVLEMDEEREEAKDVAYRFHATFKAKAQQRGWIVDSVYNIAWVFRPPETWNRKPNLEPVQVRAVALDEGARYSLDDIEPVLIDVQWARANPAAVAAVKLPVDLPRVDLASLRLSWRMRQVIRAGVDPSDANRYASRSETQWAALWALIRAGCDDATIGGVFFDPRNAVGAKARERPRSWLAADIARARVKVSEAGGGPDAAPDVIGLTKEIADAILLDDYFAQDQGGAIYVYRGGIYRPKGEQHIKQRVKILLEAWGASSSWNVKRVHEVVAYIATDAPSLWEQPPLHIVCLLNGRYDLNQEKLLPHSPEYLSSIQIPVVFDPEAACPTWDRFTADVLPPDCSDLAYELAADLMTPDRAEQRAILMVGEGANGKSTLLRAFVAFVGKRNVASISLHKLEGDKFAAARLVGKLANVCPDLPSSHLASTSVFKALTGGDVVNAERKYVDSFEFEPYCRLIFSANHPPRSDDASHAFFRRWLVVPFPNTFEGGTEKSRRDLDAALADPKELSGVLNRALAVLPRLRQHGFTESGSMRQARDEFRSSTDPLTVWLDHATVETPETYVIRDELRKAYYADCMKAGRPTLSETAFGIAFKQARPAATEAYRTVGGVRKWCYAGIGLLGTHVQSVQGSSICFVQEDVQSKVGRNGRKTADGDNNGRNPEHPEHPEQPNVPHRNGHASPPSPRRCPSCGGTMPDPWMQRCPPCRLALLDQIRADLARAGWVELPFPGMMLGPGEARWLGSLAALPPSVDLVELARRAAEVAEMAERTPL
jgi:P4 family phage/plasmid primase-like protien